MLRKGLLAAAGNQGNRVELVSYASGNGSATVTPSTLSIVDVQGSSIGGAFTLTGLEENDLVLILHADAGTTPGALVTSLFTETDLDTTANAQNATRLSYYVVPSGTTSLSFTAGGVDGGFAIAIRGADVSSAPEFSVADSDAGNCDPASITPTGGISSGDYVFVLAGFDRGVSITSGPSGYTTSITSQDDVAIWGGYKTGITAASEDPGAFVNTSDGWGVYTVHVKPTVSIADTTVDMPSDMQANDVVLLQITSKGSSYPEANTTQIKSQGWVPLYETVAKTISVYGSGFPDSHIYVKKMGETPDANLTMTGNVSYLATAYRNVSYENITNRIIYSYTTSLATPSWSPALYNTDIAVLAWAKNDGSYTDLEVNANNNFTEIVGVNALDQAGTVIYNKYGSGSIEQATLTSSGLGGSDYYNVYTPINLYSTESQIISVPYIYPTLTISSGSLYSPDVVDSSSIVYNSIDSGVVALPFFNTTVIGDTTYAAYIGIRIISANTDFNITSASILGVTANVATSNTFTFYNTGTAQSETALSAIIYATVPDGTEIYDLPNYVSCNTNQSATVLNTTVSRLYQIKRESSATPSWSGSAVENTDTSNTITLSASSGEIALLGVIAANSSGTSFSYDFYFNDFNYGGSGTNLPTSSPYYGDQGTLTEVKVECDDSFGNPTSNTNFIVVSAAWS